MKMEIYLICLASALIGGLMLSRLTKLLNLPAVTAYLVAGLLLGPFALGRLNIPGLGFQTLEQVELMGIVTQTALGFIAFTIGNEFRLAQLKAMGSSAITIGILQAVITTICVDIVLIALHLCFPEIISISCAITLGAIASATAPAATLMVVRQYKADGPLTRLLICMSVSKVLLPSTRIASGRTARLATARFIARSEAFRILISSISFSSAIAIE